MEKVGDLMRRLGFREDASDEVKKAFIRHLARTAKIEVAEVLTRDDKRPLEEGEQLSFDFGADALAGTPTGFVRRSG